MTEKSFIKWLRRFLDKTNIKELENLRHRHDPTYNHTTALREILMDINPESEIMEMNGLFKTFMYYNKEDIIILGFDSMSSRLDSMNICLSNRKFNPRLLIDGRMGAEHYQQYTFVKPKLKEYEKTWYSDDEGSSEPCNMKATSYCSNMSGSFIANTVRKVLTNQPFEAALSFNFPTTQLEKNTLYK